MPKSQRCLPQCQDPALTARHPESQNQDTDLTQGGHGPGLQQEF